MDVIFFFHYVNPLKAQTAAKRKGTGAYSLSLSLSLKSALLLLPRLLYNLYAAMYLADSHESVWAANPMIFNKQLKFQTSEDS